VGNGKVGELAIFKSVPSTSAILWWRNEIIGVIDHTKYRIHIRRCGRVMSRRHTSTKDTLATLSCM
jgi:hypothetical protein